MNEEKRRFRYDKGVAGLSILLTVISMIFIIGFLVMLFVIIGVEMQDSTWTSTTSTASNEVLTTVTEAGENFAVSTYRAVTCTVSAVTNTTSATVIPASNYTATNCNIRYKSGIGIAYGFNNSNWNVTYSFTYDADNTGTRAINDTTTALTEVVDWFPIIITISVMVALILLTVIIIVAIRSSGVMAGGGGEGEGNLGGMSA